jgi:hypothetical protein
MWKQQRITIYNFRRRNIQFQFTMIRYIALFLTFLAFSSCEKKTEWTLDEQQTHPVVVDGIITDELKTQSIRIMFAIDTLNEIPVPVAGAEVIVSGNGNVYHFHEQSGQSGNYLSDMQFAGVAGQQYSLLVTVSKKVYSAKASMDAELSTFDPAKYAYDPSDSLLQFYWVTDPYSLSSPAMYELLLDWSKVPDYLSADSTETHAKLQYYSLPTLDVSEIFAPAMKKIKFPKGTVIVERKYSLTKEYAAYLRALLLETTWQGGLFTTTSANVPTNLSSGALGYFAACSVTEKISIANGE